MCLQDMATPAAASPGHCASNCAHRSGDHAARQFQGENGHRGPGAMPQPEDITSLTWEKGGQSRNPASLHTKENSSGQKKKKTTTHEPRSQLWSNVLLATITTCLRTRTGP